MSTAGALNPFVDVQGHLDEAAAILRLEPALHAFLREPMREYLFAVPIRMDDGRSALFRGFRVLYNDARGPAKGGVRIHCEETIDHVRAMAAMMTWKTAVVNLPLGGAQGAIVSDTRALSLFELERLSRSYIGGLAHSLGATRDVPGPDMYTNPQIMAWMMDEYEAIVGHHEPGVVTGKPQAVGGSASRQDAPARGAAYVMREAGRLTGTSLQGQTAAIQGYGTAGSHMHKLAQEILGLKVIAVSDSRGGILNRHGLDPDAVWVHKFETGSVVNFPGTDAISNSELIELDVAVLIPAAVRHVITEQNADHVQACIIAELADGPTTAAADAILADRGLCLLPNLLCNAGGVTVSYFEMVQNAYQYHWSEAMVHQRLEKIMSAAYHAVNNLAQTRHVNNRVAAYLLAVARVAQAVRLRGWV